MWRNYDVWILVNNDENKSLFPGMVFIIIKNTVYYVYWFILKSPTHKYKCSTWIIKGNEVMFDVIMPKLCGHHFNRNEVLV